MRGAKKNYALRPPDLQVVKDYLLAVIIWLCSDAATHSSKATFLQQIWRMLCNIPRQFSQASAQFTTGYVAGSRPRHRWLALSAAYQPNEKPLCTTQLFTNRKRSLAEWCVLNVQFLWMCGNMRLYAQWGCPLLRTVVNEAKNQSLIAVGKKLPNASLKQSQKKMGKMNAFQLYSVLWRVWQRQTCVRRSTVRYL